MALDNIQTMALTGELFSDGRWCRGNGPELSSENPATGDLVWRGYTADEADVQKAVGTAMDAFLSWSKTTVEKRVRYLEKFASEIDTHREQLAALIHLETGKPMWESKTEVATVIGKIALSLEAYHQRTGTKITQQAQGRAVLTHRALGVFAVLGPYNFPAHLPNGHIVPALLAGNTVVFKPSEFTPMVAEFLVRCWQNIGLPEGVVNLVQGSAKTGEALASNPNIAGLLFTGSSNTGRKLHAHFAGHPEKILALEMGGNNPLVVHNCENIDAAVYAIIQSAFISAGQRCTCARRLVLVDDEQSRQLLDKLSSAVNNIQVGESDENFMGPVIHNSAAEHLIAMQDSLLARGAKALCTLTRVKPNLPFLTPGIIDVTDVQDKLDEEFFGPLLQVVRVNSFEEAIDEANNTRFGLAAGLLSDDAALWETFQARIKAGIVNWNRPTTGASGAAPFGGIGDSGNFRPSAFYAADYCAYPVASLQSDSLTLPESLSPGITL